MTSNEVDNAEGVREGARGRGRDLLHELMNLEEGIFPNNLKSTIVRLRLKKTNPDPGDMNSFRPISNLTFLSKEPLRSDSASNLSCTSYIASPPIC